MKADGSIRKRVPSGWAEPAKMTAEQRAQIRAEFSQRRAAVFHDPAKQEAFLHAIEARLTYLNTKPCQDFDLCASQDRIERFAKALAAVQDAYAALGYSEQASLGVLSGGHPAVDRFLQDNAAMLQSAEAVAESLHMPRGAHNPSPGGEVRFLVAEMATAWRRLFGKRPSPEPDGAFSAVVSTVLIENDMPPIGKAALRSLLNPSD